MTALYHLSNEYQALLQKEEYTDEDLSRLEQLHDSIEDKAIAVACHIKNMEADVRSISMAIEEMANREQSLLKKVADLKKYLLEHLVKNNIDKITKCPYFVIKSKMNPPKVNVYNEILVPAKYYVKTEVKNISKTLIKEDIIEGIEVPGASITKEMSISIK
jgi:Siphovirus Gp157